MKWFDEDLKKVNASVFKKLLAKVVIKYAPAQFLMNLVGPRTVPEMAEALKEAQADLSYRLDEIAKSAHIKVLIKNLVPEPRVEYFKQLNWFVRRTSELLILGDVCCLFKTSNSRYVSIAGPKDGIERVYLPVSGDCVVVGSVADEVPEVDVAEINEASAKVSRNYFISSANTSGLVHLSRLIGTDSNVLTKAEMEEILAGVLLRYN
jgi:hypothetical protein